MLPSSYLFYAYEGGASALIVTIFSPLNKIKPKALLTSLST
jgi:hypothetical protein